MFKSCQLPCQIAASILGRLQYKIKVINAPGQRGQITILFGDEKIIPTPEIHIKKVNPTKYIFSVKKATDSFFIRLDENFDRGWKAYMIPYKKKIELEGSPYKSVEKPLGTLGPRELEVSHRLTDCESKECNGKKHLELSASLKDLSFPSKIRNALKLEQIFMWPEVFHWEVDGYANAWYIDLGLLKTVDEEFKEIYHAYDEEGMRMNIVVEYSPQKLHFIGLMGSLATLGLLGIYFIILPFNRFKKAPRNNTLNP